MKKHAKIGIILLSAILLISMVTGILIWDYNSNSIVLEMEFHEMDGSEKIYGGTYAFLLDSQRNLTVIKDLSTYDRANHMGGEERITAKLSWFDYYQVRGIMLGTYIFPQTIALVVYHKPFVSIYMHNNRYNIYNYYRGNRMYHILLRKLMQVSPMEGVELPWGWQRLPSDDQMGLYWFWD